MMKLYKRLFIVVLALLLTIVSPMQILAAAQPQYISEIRIGYGDAGKTALESEGFTVWQNLNANEGGNGSEVWLGYTTTANPDEAITDIAMMNMKGGYSFDAYTREVENLNRQVSEQLAFFKAAIVEFRTNYAQGSPFAEQARKVMNGFCEDDTVDEDGVPAGIGDVFLDEATTDETLHKIFLEGNTEAVAAIETALALACIETDEENVLTRLEESEYPDVLDPSKNTARTAVKTVFADFHSTAVSLQTLMEEVESFDGGADAFLEQPTLSEEEQIVYARDIAYYTFLSETDFGSTGMSLLDFALLDEETPNEDGEVLEDEYLEMLVQAMTDGQLGIVATVGILTVLFNATAAEYADEAIEKLESVEETAAEPVSVYYGVDRQLFENTDGIALTSTALREKAAAEQSSFGEDANADKSKAVTLTAAAAGAYVVGAVFVACNLKAALTPVLVQKMERMGYQSFYYVEQANVAGIVMTAVGCIAIIAAVVLTIFALMQWYEKPSVPQTNYTQIPKAIVEKPEGHKAFIAYYAAKLAGAAENETESTKLYGDLNGLNKIDQWVGLYYSKNSDLGAPITAEMLQSATGTLNASEAKSYSPIHMFGSTAAANLNQYNTGSGAKAIYVFLRSDAEAVNQTGSVFTSGTVILNLVAFLVGAGIASAVTYLVMRKKKLRCEA